MKFTSEDLMKAMGLKVGDKIKVNGRYYTIEINELSGLPVYANDKKYLNIIYLLDKEIEILPQPKRVGDLKCKDLECENCPLRALINCNSHDNNNQRLFDNLAKWTNEYISFDQEIYDLLKARLDKEVKEND